MFADEALFEAMFDTLRQAIKRASDKLDEVIAR
jgi:hypothetical protein